MFPIIYFEYGSNYFFLINNFVKYVLYVHVDPHKMILYPRCLSVFI